MIVGTGATIILTLLTTLIIPATLMSPPLLILMTALSLATSAARMA